MTIGWPDPYFSLTSSEEADLKDRNFLESYRRHRGELVDFAKEVFCIVEHTLLVRPSEDQFYRVYWRSLMQDELYVTRIAGAKHHLPVLSYEHYAKLLTKYLIRMDGQEISGYYCY